MQELRANTETIVRIGPFVDVTDGYTPETGIDVSVADEAELLKHGGGATVDISGNTWVAIANCDGYYNLTLTAGNLDTVGQLTVVVQDVSECRPVRCDFMVLDEESWDAKYPATVNQVDRLYGIRRWPIYGEDQLFALEANDNGIGTFPASCVWDGLAWRLYYTAWSGSAYIIRYRSSTDGKTSWSVGTTVLTPGPSSYDNEHVILPIVWREGATWHMIYTGEMAGAGQTRVVCYATSADGDSWTKHASNPVMEGDTSNWERGKVESTGVIKVGSTYYMWYNSPGFVTGRDATSRQSSYATSPDLINWTKSPTCVWGDDDDEAARGPHYGTLGGTVLRILNHYYYFSVVYGPNSDYERIEVWQSHDPTFPALYRHRVAIIQTVSDSAFPDSEIDVLCFATNDITRSTFTVGGLSGEIRMYFGAKHSGSWVCGLSTVASTLEALRPGLSIADQITEILHSGRWLRASQAVADEVFVRDMDQVEASAPEHSLCTIVLAALESSISGSSWVIRRTDGSTTHVTKNVSTNAAASPVTGVS